MTLKIEGWTGRNCITYVMRDEDVAAYTDRVLNVLNADYVLDNGEKIQGQSLSYVVAELRYRRCKLPGNTVEQARVLEALGFRVVRGRSVGRNQAAEVVTV